MEQESLALVGTIVAVIYFGIIAISIASFWKILSKAGQPGWASLVPIYNIIKLIEVAQKPVGMTFLFLIIPFVNIYGLWTVSAGLAQSFNKSTGFAVGLFLLPIVFMPMLAFGSAEYSASASGPAETFQPKHEGLKAG